MVARPVREDYNTAVITRQEGELTQTLPLVVTGTPTVFTSMQEIRNTIVLSGDSILTVTLPTPVAGVDDGVRVAIVATDDDVAHIVNAGALTLTWLAALSTGVGIELVAHGGGYEVVANLEVVIS